MSKIIASSEKVITEIERVATEILRDHSTDRPLFVSLLRGAAPFGAELMFAIGRLAPDYHPELDYMMISTYGNGRTAGEPHIVTDLAPTTSIADRTVIVLDDVLDKGVTAHFVSGYILSRGAREVKLAVLVDKKTDRTHPIAADYACLQTDDVWLAGMGMDDAATATEAYRWSDYIIEIN